MEWRRPTCCRSCLCCRPTVALCLPPPHTVSRPNFQPAGRPCPLLLLLLLLSLLLLAAPPRHRVTFWPAQREHSAGVRVCQLERNRSLVNRAPPQFEQLGAKGQRPTKSSPASWPTRQPSTGQLGSPRGHLHAAWATCRPAHSDLSLSIDLLGAGGAQCLERPVLRAAYLLPVAS